MESIIEEGADNGELQSMYFHSAAALANAIEVLEKLSESLREAQIEEEKSFIEECDSIIIVNNRGIKKTARGELKWPHVKNNFKNPITMEQRDDVSSEQGGDTKYRSRKPQLKKEVSGS